MKRVLNIGKRLVILTAVSGLAAAAIAPVTVSAAGGGSRSKCVDVKDFKVAPAPGKARTWKVSGTYCEPGKWASGQRQVDVLTPGSTYTRSYWDWPVESAKYSYADKTLAAGRAVVYYDRIGSGASTRPHSSEITMDTDAHVLHQIIQKLRDRGYKHVNSIGHSYGSGVALHEATKYRDVRRLVLTGYLHQSSNPLINAGNWAANQDPFFEGLGLDDGYITSRPGARGAAFYSSSASQTVIDYDEAHKNTTSRPGLLDFIAERQAPADTNLSSTIRVPVLVIAGQQDAVFCYEGAPVACSQSAMAAHEKTFYAKSSNLKVVMVPDTGHNLPLHPSGGSSFKAIDQWLAKRK